MLLERGGLIISWEILSKPVVVEPSPRGGYLKPENVVVAKGVYRVADLVSHRRLSENKPIDTASAQPMREAAALIAPEQQRRTE